MSEFADISSHNSTFDPFEYLRGGHTTIAIKATESTGYVNPYWSLWANAAHAAGLRVVHYHYAGLPDSALQAQFFLNTVGSAYRSGDVLCLDHENPGMPASRRAAFSDDFLSRLYGEKWIYSGKWYLEPGNVGYQGAQLWLASYTPSMPIPYGFTRSQIVAWQYTDAAQVPGIGHAGRGVDYSRYYGPVSINTNRFQGFMSLREGDNDLGPTGVFPDTHHPVQTLQNALNIALRIEGRNPNNIHPDGRFGPQTNNAVIVFQRSVGLQADGVVGPKTWAALDVALDALHR